MELQVNTKENYSTQDLLVVAFIFVACIAVYFLGWWPPLFAVLLACLIIYSVFRDPLGSVSKLWVNLAPGGDPMGSALRTMSRVFSRAFGSPCKSSGNREGSQDSTFTCDRGTGCEVVSADLSASIKPVIVGASKRNSVDGKDAQSKVTDISIVPIGYITDSPTDGMNGVQPERHLAQPQATLVAPSQSSAFTGTAAHRALNAESTQQLT